MPPTLPSPLTLMTLAIGDALASREISAFLRDMGEMGGGPKPYAPKDRSNFLNQLEIQIQALLKAQRLKSPPRV